MMGEEVVVAIIAILSLFVILPGMIFHYITMWRKQKTLLPDDERMLEDLWRSARAMERRIETIERLIDTESDDPNQPRSRRPLRSDRFED